MTPILPLKQQWKPEHIIFTKEEIVERCRSEDNYTWARGYPLIKNEDIKSSLIRE